MWWVGYLCPATGGEGGVKRLRGYLDQSSLGEDLTEGREVQDRLAGVEAEVGRGGVVDDVGGIQPVEEVVEGCCRHS